jgi:hypothetical protein
MTHIPLVVILFQVRVSSIDIKRVFMNITHFLMYYSSL